MDESSQVPAPIVSPSFVDQEVALYLNDFEEDSFFTNLPIHATTTFRDLISILSQYISQKFLLKPSEDEFIFLEELDSPIFSNAIILESRKILVFIPPDQTVIPDTGIPVAKALEYVPMTPTANQALSYIPLVEGTVTRESRIMTLDYVQELCGLLDQDSWVTVRNVIRSFEFDSQGFCEFIVMFLNMRSKTRSQTCSFCKLDFVGHDCPFLKLTEESMHNLTNEIESSVASFTESEHQGVGSGVSGIPDPFASNT